MSKDWSIENELCKLAKNDSLAESLHYLHLINEPSESFEIVTDDKWIRGGAETYIYDFMIRTESSCNKYMLKACVAMSYGSSLIKILDDWIARRKIIASSGISTPKLYTHGEGVILEEFIEFSLKETLINRFDKSLLLQLANLAGFLECQGFLSIDPFKDLRSRGSDVVMIDFGEDLGPPNQKSVFNEKLFDFLVEKLNGWGVVTDDETLLQMKSLYDSQ